MIKNGLGTLDFSEVQASPTKLTNFMLTALKPLPSGTERDYLFESVAAMSVSC